MKTHKNGAIELNLSPEQAQHLQQQAKASRITQSAYVARLVVADATRAGLLPMAAKGGAA